MTPAFSRPSWTVTPYHTPTCLPNTTPHCDHPLSTFRQVSIITLGFAFLVYDCFGATHAAAIGYKHWTLKAVTLVNYVACAGARPVTGQLCFAERPHHHAASPAQFWRVVDRGLHVRRRKTAEQRGQAMMMIAFITVSSGLVPLIEGLCAQI